MARSLSTAELRVIRNELAARQEGRCGTCGLPDQPLQLRRRVPHSKGGSETIINFVAQCAGCNVALGDRVHPSVVDPLPLLSRRVRAALETFAGAYLAAAGEGS